MAGEFCDPNQNLSSTSKAFGGYQTSNIPLSSSRVRVTDILIRGGGGTITFSDNVTVDYVFGFRPDATIPSGGIFDVTLCGDRANLVYENVVSQCVCDMIDWLLQCSSINNRLSIIEAKMGLAKDFAFTASDWSSGTVNEIEIIREGIPGAGQLGPHEFPLGVAYSVSVFESGGSPVIIGTDTEVQINIDTGSITLRKAPLGPNFSGRVIIGSITCF